MTRALLLQGGGCRTFFQLGLLSTVGDALDPVDEIGAVSASTAMACAHLLGIHDEAVGHFRKRVRKNPANFYPRRAFGRERMTPHLEMFRETILDCVSEDRFRALARQPVALRFLVGVGPSRSRAVLLALAAAAAVTKRPAPFVAAHVVDARALPDARALAEMILASSAFPPFTPLPTIGGRPAVDGGAVESVPLSLASPGASRTAILTRPTPWRPLPPSVRVLAPSAPLPIAIWDYANEALIVRTYDEGRRAGDALRATSSGRS